MLVAILLTRSDVLVCPLLLITAAATFRMKYLKTAVMQTRVETDRKRHRVFVFLAFRYRPAGTSGVWTEIEKRVGLI